MLLEPGTLAPDFTAPDQHGNPFTLSSLRGQKVALYFYPKDDTPGCTAQACTYATTKPSYRPKASRWWA